MFSIFGSLTAGLLDDVLGQTTIHEAQVRGILGAPLTASLEVKYKRPVLDNNVYLVSAQVDSIAPRDRPGPPSWNVQLSAKITDAKGNTAVEATSRYVIMGRPP